MPRKTCPRPSHCLIHLVGAQQWFLEVCFLMSLNEYASVHRSDEVENETRLKKQPFSTVLGFNVCVVMQMHDVSCDARLSTWVLESDVCCEGQYTIECVAQLSWIAFWCIADSFGPSM
ncbi:hypothetical protein AVEN_230450-1 [Araneus ventricosus]|uniref:Uncharacterized protein n=1 Tax=Araneus ventricosus TaxID=182803 RepID=A0A4Y2KQ87_ARAVE|nr:hypothetical protein AVEN_230450-1 [Araneus ventricosus]